MWDIIIKAAWTILFFCTHLTLSKKYGSKLAAYLVSSVHVSGATACGLVITFSRSYGVNVWLPKYLEFGFGYFLSDLLCTVNRFLVLRCKRSDAHPVELGSIALIFKEYHQELECVLFIFHHGLALVLIQQYTRYPTCEAMVGALLLAEAAVIPVNIHHFMRLCKLTFSDKQWHGWPVLNLAVDTLSVLMFAWLRVVGWVASYRESLADPGCVLSVDPQSAQAMGINVSLGGLFCIQFMFLGALLMSLKRTYNRWMFASKHL
jgi:hypothetical protein